MPDLTPMQRAQAIGRLNADHRPYLVAYAFNCIDHTIQHDVTMQYKHARPSHIAVAQELQGSVRIGTSTVIIYKIGSLQ